MVADPNAPEGVEYVLHLRCQGGRWLAECHPMGVWKHVRIWNKQASLEARITEFPLSPSIVPVAPTVSPPLTVPALPADSPPNHSDDYRKIFWRGIAYDLTRQQAKVVQLLWEAWERGAPEVDDKFLLDSCLSNTERLRDVFKEKGKMVPAWKNLIDEGDASGTHRLVFPPRATFPA